jgi:hypothetical protein
VAEWSIKPAAKPAKGRGFALALGEGDSVEDHLLERIGA